MDETLPFVYLLNWRGWLLIGQFRLRRSISWNKRMESCRKSSKSQSDLLIRILCIQKMSVRFDVDDTSSKPQYFSFLSIIDFRKWTTTTETKVVGHPLCYLELCILVPGSCIAYTLWLSLRSVLKLRLTPWYVCTRSSESVVDLDFW